MRGLPIPRYPNLRMGVPSRRALVRLWSHQRPDIVHIATEGPLGWSALQAAGQLRLPVTSDFRTNFHAYSRHYGVGWLSRPIMSYLRKFHNRTQATMVPTAALRSDLHAAGFRCLHVVTRGVDTARFSPERRSEALRASWGAGPDDPVLACVGRLAAEKNLDRVIEAYEAARQVNPRCRLLLVGDGPMRDAITQRCPEAILAGQRGGEDLAAHYASADLFVFASLTETFGNVTTEALASGLAVVAYRHAAAAELIESGREGVLIEPPDRASFVAAVCALVADRARGQALGHAARQRALGLGWSAIVAQFEAVLRDVLLAHEQGLAEAPRGLLQRARQRVTGAS